jgi:hypothetical protein
MLPPAKLSCTLAAGSLLADVACPSCMPCPAHSATLPALPVGAGESAAGGIGELSPLPDQVVKSPIPAQLTPGWKWSTVSVGMDPTCGVDAKTAQTLCWG